MMEDILELLKDRYPDKVPLVEISPFRMGELAGYQKIIREIEVEVKNATNNR